MAPSIDKLEKESFVSGKLCKIKEDCIHYLRSKRVFSSTIIEGTLIGGEKGILLDDTNFPTLSRELPIIVQAETISKIDFSDVGALNHRTLGAILARMEPYGLQMDVLILESVDSISSESVVLSMLLKLLDQGESSCFIIGTCKDIRAVPDELTKPYRLGPVTYFPLPTVDHRDELFRVLLGDSGLLISSDAAMDEVAHGDRQLASGGTVPEHRLAWELARRTQGLSEYDITMLVKNEIEDSFLLGLFSEAAVTATTSPPPPLVQVSARKLLNASYCDLQPISAELLTWPEGDASGPQPVPVVLGLEEIRKQLLSWTIGCVPSHRKRAALSISPSSSQSQSQLSSLDSNVLKRLLNIRPCSGIVISGPSSSGKTLLATWLAYETRSQFKFISVSCADLVHKVVGETEKKISEIFKDARRIAPCFILLDNLEAVVGLPPDVMPARGGSRSHSRRTQHRAIDRMLSALLTEIDGVREDDSPGSPAGMGHGRRENIEESHVIVIATTADRALLDRALLRPGRLELHIELSLPDRRQRSLFFVDFFSLKIPAVAPKMEVDLTGQILIQSDIRIVLHGVKQVSFTSFMSTLVTATTGRSYAQLKNAIQEALLTLMRNKSEEGILMNVLCTNLASLFNLVFFSVG